MIAKSHEKFVQEVKDKFDSEYIVIDSYVNCNTKIHVKHNKCKYKWMVNPNNFLQGKSKCPQCNGRVRYNTKTYNKKVKQLTNGEFSILGEYKNALTYIKMRHNICNFEWDVNPHTFIRGSRCPKCFGNLPYTTETFKKKVKEITNGEYVSKGEYYNNTTRIKIKHIDCEFEWDAVPSSFLNGDSRCPNCSIHSSQGEKLISDFLFKRKVKFISQYTIDECRNKVSLRFDFAVLDKNKTPLFLIEFDGKQHFETIDFYGGEEGYRKRKINDNIKDEFCKENNINLIRIPYWETDNIERTLTELLNEQHIKENILLKNIPVCFKTKGEDEVVRDEVNYNDDKNVKVFYKKK